MFVQFLLSPEIQVVLAKGAGAGPANSKVDLKPDERIGLPYGEDVKKLIGYLPENNPLYLDMAVIDYLEFTAALQGVPKGSINERIYEMIRTCGLNAEKHKKG